MIYLGEHLVVRKHVNNATFALSLPSGFSLFLRAWVAGICDSGILGTKSSSNFVEWVFCSVTWAKVQNMVISMQFALLVLYNSWFSTFHWNFLPRNLWFFAGC